LRGFGFNSNKIIFCGAWTACKFFCIFFEEKKKAAHSPSEDLAFGVAVIRQMRCPETRKVHEKVVERWGGFRTLNF